MSVLVEVISVIVKRQTIAERYPGGWHGYCKDAPNKTLCFDDEIARVGFMTPQDVGQFVKRLEARGFVFVKDKKFIDIAAVQPAGFCDAECDWLELGQMNDLKTGGSCVFCRLRGSTSDDLFTPEGWTFDLSGELFTIPKEEVNKRLIFLNHENGLDVYLDTDSGKKVYQARTGKR